MWAGITMHGPTPICIFEGIVNKELYVKIICETFVLYLHTTFPEAGTHRFMQDNDPKHVSRYARDFLANSNIGELLQSHLI